MGLHEALHLPDTKHSLLSTGQACEHGVWLSDVLKRHGGDQRLAVPFFDSKEMFDVDLEARNELLNLATRYPTEDELENLPVVWLTSGYQPWDPYVLDSNDGVILPSYNHDDINISMNPNH